MSATTRNQVFSAVHTVGGLLPADILVRIAEGKDVSGSKPADYGVIGSRSVRDDAERHWDYLKGAWRELRARLPEDADTGAPAADPTGLATAQWLEPLFAELGFGRLTAVGAAGIPADGDAERLFAVSHRWQHTLIHLTAWNTDLDKRVGGAGTVPPQSMLQECLNRTEAHLWGVLSNGRRLRLLRDSSALATASYVEFDLEAIFDGELFSEFVLLYRLLHVSRFEVAEGTAASACRMEKWRTEAIASGTRALDQLRKGVQDAITTLGTGFLRHPDNAALRENLKAQDLHNALLRLAYRLLFLFVAEDRDALHAPEVGEQERERYAMYFSSARLRAHARRRRGTAHGDRWQALRVVLDALGDENGRPELGLPGLGGLFTNGDADVPLDGLSLSNEYLLTAVRHLAQVRDIGSHRWRAVDYRHLDAEELGSIYESLLELVPQHSAVDRTFELVELAGNTRKTTGSYYTPSSLIDCLLDSALDPVIDDAVKRGEQAAKAASRPDPAEDIVAELLALTVCDPACGSGHFLVAAARRIAKRVAAVRERNPEPTLVAVRHALHEVVARCIYGVDLNPMAVELAKVSLWLEALEPGKALSFLDAHMKHGNALIGATPKLLRGGVPNDAFKPIEGDDKNVAKSLEKQNGLERAGQRSLFNVASEIKVANTEFATDLRRIAASSSDTLASVRLQEAAFRDLENSTEYIRARHLADAWCAAFMWQKIHGAPMAVTEEVFRNLQNAEPDSVPKSTNDEIVRLFRQHQFFHWHLEFPDVFSVSASTSGMNEATGWTGGFSCVLGNPPWDSVDLKEQEFFAQRSPAISAAPNAAARKKMINALERDSENRSLFDEYTREKRKVHAESHFLRKSERFPTTGQGNLNTYSLFAETGRSLISSYGRMGAITPTGIATDARTQHFFKSLVQGRSLAALFDFENSAPIFPDVHRSFKFSILSVAGTSLRERAADFAFFLRSPDDLADGSVKFSLEPEEILSLNPNTGTCPVFRSRRDARIVLDVYRLFPVLVEDDATSGNPWSVSFMDMFNMSHDSDLFSSASALEDDGWGWLGNSRINENDKLLPLYEGKMAHHFDHRWATYSPAGIVADLALADKRNSRMLAIPRYWVNERMVLARLNEKGWGHEWLLGWRDVARATDDRTAIPAVVPRAAVGDKLPILISLRSPEEISGLYACQASFIFDYVSRQKIGGTSMSKFIWKQLPVPPPNILAPHLPWLACRVDELSYTAVDMRPFARDMGDGGEPFRWDEIRRAVIRAELDAFFFHLYGIARGDVDYILDTFPIVKRKDEAKYGAYRTKELILSIYDRMAAAGVSLTTPLVDGENFTSTLTPPPGQGPRHPASTADGPH
ncbi:N-6 DNA methylase [Kitasatospora aureofaciens]|uniref:Eco57I restriction-modification methylase domain-containing protein n=1 Tax=Kitasatospora aureofaciens TaxID=1894 RepID=UPI001C490648|nr:DNA methyltransferase [Kitasatospora aureofaciens]MBV6695896.1 N-6 DNA methylase [Kitasatospora aureofaciens]